MSLRRVIMGAGGAYCSEARSLFARMTTQPSLTRKALINSTIMSLKLAGVWSLMDAIYVTAAHDVQAAKLNWKPGGSFNLTGSPTFTTDRGTVGSLSTGFNPSTAGGNYALTSAYLGFWSRTAAGATLPGMGVYGAVNAGFVPDNGSGGSNMALNQTNVASGSSVTPTLWCSVARSGANYTSYRANSVVITNSFSATAVPSAALALGADGRQQAAGAIGQYLDATHDLAFYNALQTYMTAVGA